MRRRLVFGGMTLLAMPAAARLQAGSAAEEVAAANATFDATLSRRDLAALEALWVQDDSVTAIHPRDRAVTLGWAAVRRSWEATFARFAELSVDMPEPKVQVIGETAVVTGLENVRGRRPTDGVTVAFEAMTTNVYRRQGGRWLMVHHHATMLPT